MRSLQLAPRYLNRSRGTFRGLATHIPAWKSFATVDPWELSDTKIHTVSNLVQGNWSNSGKKHVLPDPMTGKIFMHVSDVQESEISAYVSSLKECSKSGLHNPLKDPQRYLKFGDISARAAAKMRDPEGSFICLSVCLICPAVLLCFSFFSFMIFILLDFLPESFFLYLLHCVHNCVSMCVRINHLTILNVSLSSCLTSSFC